MAPSCTRQGGAARLNPERGLVTGTDSSVPVVVAAIDNNNCCSCGAIHNPREKMMLMAQRRYPQWRWVWLLSQLFAGYYISFFANAQTLCNPGVTFAALQECVRSQIAAESLRVDCRICLDSFRGLGSLNCQVLRQGICDVVEFCASSCGPCNAAYKTDLDCLLETRTGCPSSQHDCPRFLSPPPTLAPIRSNPCATNVQNLQACFASNANNNNNICESCAERFKIDGNSLVCDPMLCSDLQECTSCQPCQSLIEGVWTCVQEDNSITNASDVPNTCDLSTESPTLAPTAEEDTCEVTSELRECMENEVTINDGIECQQCLQTAVSEMTTCTDYDPCMILDDISCQSCDRCRRSAQTYLTCRAERVFTDCQIDSSSTAVCPPSPHNDSNDNDDETDEDEFAERNAVSNGLSIGTIAGIATACAFLLLCLVMTFLLLGRRRRKKRSSWYGETIEPIDVRPVPPEEDVPTTASRTSATTTDTDQTAAAGSHRSTSDNSSKVQTRTTVIREETDDSLPERGGDLLYLPHDLSAIAEGTEGSSNSATASSFRSSSNSINTQHTMATTVPQGNHGPKSPSSSTRTIDSHATSLDV